MLSVTILALAGLAVGAAVNDGETSLTRSITSNDMGGRPSRMRKMARFAQVSLLIITSTSVDVSVPIITGTPISSSADISVSMVTGTPVSYGFIAMADNRATTSFTGCGSGYSQVPSTHSSYDCTSFMDGSPNGGRKCTFVTAWPTLSCSAIGCKDGDTLRPPFEVRPPCNWEGKCPPPTETYTFTDTSSCVSHSPPYTRPNRWVARFANATPTPVTVDKRKHAQARSGIEDTDADKTHSWPYWTRCLGGRWQWGVAAFAARTTQDFGGGRSQHLVARHVETRSHNETPIAPPSSPTKPTRSHSDVWSKTRSNVEVKNSPTTSGGSDPGSSPSPTQPGRPHPGRPTSTHSPAAQFTSCKNKGCINYPRDSKAAHQEPISLPTIDPPTPTRAPSMPHITATPTLTSSVSINGGIPLCSFNKTKGQYACPTQKSELPPCSFDTKKGGYVSDAYTGA